MLEDLFYLRKQCRTNYQKRTSLDISRYLLSRYEDDPGDIIKGVVTQDETWCLHFDPGDKNEAQKLKYSGSPLPKKFKQVHSAGKVMASIFWDSQGVIMVDYLEQDSTRNTAYYAGKLRWLPQEKQERRKEN